MKLWGGRFAKETSQLMDDFHSSISFDSRLAVQDITGSIAHARMLGQQGIIAKEDSEKIIAGLKTILEDAIMGNIEFSPHDEDIHMNVEVLLTNKIGAVGKKLHTGRSRNDQVCTDFKLYMRHRATEIRALEVSLMETVLDLAKKYFGKMMPGYTHLQQAQPIYFSHYLMSMFFAVSRDVKRLDNFLELHSELPLGSGAMAGSAFPYHRALVAKELGFNGVSPNSIDAVSHRDMMLEFEADLAIIANTMSRYAEDFVNWSTSEFGYLTLHDAFSSGSSMMPQKKNPDSMELIRGKSGRMLGNFSALYTLVKGAPLSYSRDLQEDKEPVFDSVHNVKVILRVMKEALESARFNFDKMHAKMLPALLATDLADLLVESGVPFRDAHHVVGSLVGEAARQGLEFTDLSDEAWASAGVPNVSQMKKTLTFEYSVSRRNIEGGTGPKSVKQQFVKADAILKKFKK